MKFHFSCFSQALSKKTCFIIVSFLFIAAQVHAQALTIVNITGTESRCSSSGTLTVTASGRTSPYQYAITGGAITYANQNSNVFTALAPQTYTVRVTDKTGTSVFSIGNIITGTYSTMAPSHILKTPTCLNGNDGTITVTIPSNTGRAPYGFQLITPSPITTGIITPGTNTYTFTGLTSGNYRYRVSDSCANIQTRDVVIGSTTVPPPFGVKMNRIYKRTCSPDSIDAVYAATQRGKFPLTIELYYNNASVSGTPDFVYTDPGPSSKVVRIPQTTIAGAVHTIRVIDACGDVASGSFRTHYIDAYVSPAAPQGCNNNDLRVDYLGLATSVRFELFSGIPATGAAIATRDVTTITEDFNGYTDSFFVFTNVAPGPYTVRATDSCGDAIEDTYNQPALVKQVSAVQKTCVVSMDKTVQVRYNFTGMKTPILIEWLSGTTSYTSAYNNYTATISYPFTDTIDGVGTDDFGNFYRRTNVPVGDYQVRFTDSCGFTKTVSLSVTNADVNSFQNSVVLIPGCLNANTIKLITANSCHGQRLTLTNLSGTQIGTRDDTQNASDTLTVTSVPSGTYIANFAAISGWPFGPSRVSFVGGGDEYTKKDTIVVAPYTQPVISNSSQAVACSGSSTGTITVNSTGGAGTFIYEVISGPATRSPQSSPVFPSLPSPGTYTVKATDGCGNSSTYSISMAALSPPNITANSVCSSNGQPVILTADSVYNATYSWIGPGGFTAARRSISIPASTATTGGTYTVTLSLTGCGDVTKSYNLNACAELPVSLTSFDARVHNCKVQLNWHAATELGFLQYVVEYSPNGTGFASVGTVEAKGDNSSYTFNHQPAEGKSYYRLHMIDTNGGEKLSKILYVVVNCSGVSSVSIYPNPAKNKAIITGLPPQARVSLLDIAGQKLTTIFPASTTYELDLSGYARGTYLLQVIGKNGEIIQTIKMIKQ